MPKEELELLEDTLHSTHGLTSGSIRYNMVKEMVPADMSDPKNPKPAEYYSKTDALDHNFADHDEALQNAYALIHAHDVMLCKDDAVAKGYKIKNPNT